MGEWFKDLYTLKGGYIHLQVMSYRKTIGGTVLKHLCIQLCLTSFLETFCKDFSLISHSTFNLQFLAMVINDDSDL